MWVSVCGSEDSFLFFFFSLHKINPALRIRELPEPHGFMYDMMWVMIKGVVLRALLGEFRRW